MKTFKIGKDVVGGGKTYIIAEVAQAHDGNVNFAHNFIDNVADTGVEAVKFQMHISEEESTLEEPFRVKFSRLDDTRYDYWNRINFTTEEWAGLVEHCKQRGITFLCTPLSVKAVEILDKLGTPAFKVGSGEVETPDIFEAIAKTKKPLLLSSGMSSYEMTDRAVKWMDERKMEYGLFQCTTKYPTPLNEVGLNVMDEFRKRYDCPVGLSDHSANINVALLAMARGADLLEMHVTLHKKAFGPDTIGSLSFEEFAQLVKIRDEWMTVDANPVDKDKVATGFGDMLKKFSKSVGLRQDAKAGTVLTRDMLTLKKPGVGIAPQDIDKLVGQTLAQDVCAKEEVLKWHHIKKA